jgi:hypothetical protein
VVLSIRDTSSGDEGHPSEDEIGIYNLLVFLWAVEKRWTAPVIIQDPPDTQEAYTILTGRSREKTESLQSGLFLGKTL